MGVSGVAPGERIRQRWFVIYTLLLAAGLLTLAVAGIYSRYLADDFCTAGTLRQMGFGASQAYWYLTWSGRYAFTALISLTHVAGPRFTPLLPGALLALWFVALMAAASQGLGLRRTGMSRWLAAGVGAGVLLSALLAAPSLYQSLYWQTGLLTYATPLVLWTGYAAWLLWRLGPENPQTPGWVSAVGSGAFLFFAGGFSETTAVLQVILVGSALFGCLALGTSRVKRQARRPLVAGLVGALLALTVVALAPGNQARLGLMPDPPPWDEWLALSARHLYLFGARMVRREWLSLLLPFVLMAAALIPRHASSPQAPDRRGVDARAWWAILWVVLTGLAACLATMALAAYAQSAFPDGRVLLPAVYVLVAGSAAVGALLSSQAARLAGNALRRVGWVLIAGRIAVLLLALVASAQAIRSAQALVPDARPFAQAWDRRDDAARSAAAQGVRELAVASLTHMGGLAEIARDEAVWVNRCFADTYNLDRVVAK